MNKISQVSHSTSLAARTSLQMFLQRQTAHEPLLTLVAQPGPVTVVLAGVNQHGVLRDELEVAAGAVDLTVGGGEGRTVVLPEKVFVPGVVGGDVVLHDVQPGEGHVAERTGVSHPRVFLPQVSLEVLD